MTEEYIRKQDAVDVASEDGKKIPTVVIRIMHDIKALSPADVAPVVHAYWIRHENADVFDEPTEELSESTVETAENDDFSEPARSDADGSDI